MEEKVDDKFIQEVNQNLGIAHKVGKMYFSDPADREDVIQEMMYQLWKSYTSFDGRSKFSTWMYRVCLNTALTYRKKNVRNENELISAKHQEIATGDHEEKDESAELLFNAMKVLSPLNKAIVLLYLEDLSYDEIASLTGLTKSNVSVKLVRIKRELESELRRIKV